MPMILPYLVATLAQSPPPPMAPVRAIMREFGYPEYSPSHWIHTAGGGWIADDGTIELSIDRRNIPQVLKITKVKYEVSDSATAIPRIKALLSRYPLRLPSGKWVTERSLAADPFGASNSSHRYFFVPVSKGFPHSTAFMTVQLSADCKRVLEWMYHPIPLTEGAIPPGGRAFYQGVLMTPREVHRRYVADTDHLNAHPPKGPRVPHFIPREPVRDFSIFAKMLRRFWNQSNPPKLTWSIDWPLDPPK